MFSIILSVYNFIHHTTKPETTETILNQATECTFDKLYSENKF